MLAFCKGQLCFNIQLVPRKLSTNMLEYLVTYNSSVSDVYMKVIANNKCQLSPFTFGLMFYTTNKSKIANIYARIYVSLLMLSYICWEINTIQYSMLLFSGSP